MRMISLLNAGAVVSVTTTSIYISFIKDSAVCQSAALRQAQRLGAHAGLAGGQCPDAEGLRVSFLCRQRATWFQSVWSPPPLFSLRPGLDPGSRFPRCEERSDAAIQGGPSRANTAAQFAGIGVPGLPRRLRRLAMTNRIAERLGLRFAGSTNDTNRGSTWVF